MGRFRQWRKTGAALGLFALLLQLWLSFGHVHADVAPAESAATVAATATPTESDDDGTIHRDFCAICAGVQLLGWSLVPLAPAITPPPLTASVEHAPRRSRISPAAPPRHFQARAPPLA